MKAGSFMKAIVAAVVCLFIFGGRQATANPVSMVGEQDFPDGAVVNFDSNWLSAQTNESPPSAGLYPRPSFITYFHDGLDPGLPGMIAFSLWNLDSSQLGNQVTDFRLDNIPQPISAFETGRPTHTVELFQYPVPTSALADGQVQVFLMLGS